MSTPNPDPQSVRRRGAVVVSLLVLGALLLVLGGCAGSGGTVQGAAPWRTPGAQLAAERADGPRPSMSAHVLYSTDPLGLRQELQTRCAGMDGRGTGAVLSTLVTDLYLSGVEPGEGAEALLRGGCAPVSEIVTEMIAQGGESAFDPVLERALMLTGSGARETLELAAAEGLERRARLLDASDGPLRESLVYAMRYYPSGAPTSETQTAVAMNLLFERAESGYGLYTFVLLGRTSALDAADVQRYRELFRIIETYVASASGVSEPRREAHAFLVPVYADSGDMALVDQLAPELSDLMRYRLGRALRRHGRPGPAARLESGAGPFLMTSTDPQLLPLEVGAPRLLIDLSGVGAEYLYGIIDACDRPVEDAAALERLRERLRLLLDEAPADWLEWIEPRAPSTPRAATVVAAPSSVVG
ncbi:MULTISPECIES: hypothetical protein [Marichromatium]|uniref:Uncharacterized protein n=1 Tax=Marichromatium gracile TaxID=1048 RepID=A0A4R4A5C5_MARGR|nr:MULTISPECIES: hypothetical protein [Marichromatium]MBO8086381.1 hypothetical protein [Marichromatium sp.]TCW33385.1 hypothetical protein EDC29_11432 [Marichromatium gracile]